MSFLAQLSTRRRIPRYLSFICRYLALSRFWRMAFLGVSSGWRDLMEEEYCVHTRSLSMRNTTYAITPYDSHSHPWKAHIVVKMKKDQVTQRQVQVIVLGSIAHKKLSWHKQIMEWCRRRHMLRSGNPFNVKLQSGHRRMLGYAVPFRL